MSNEKGLSSADAKKRLEQYGGNEIKEVGKISLFKLLLRQIKSNFIIYLLFAAMFLSFVVGKSITAYTIFVVIILVIFIGFIQEFRAEKSISALKGMITPVSIVLRDGKEQEIFSKEIVPGDILILRNGEKIPADCIIIEQRDLLVDESILTGESNPVKKEVAENQKKYSDKNSLFMGSFIVNGKCTAKVVHTGMGTKFGKIAGMISTAEKELPLQKKVNKIAKYMAIIGITISVLTGLIILFTSTEINEEIIISILILVIAISVSSFPEGFPVVLITTLSLGVYRMAKKNSIVNRISIIETLGETTVICSDKTGTITKGEMTVKKIFTDEKEYNVSGAGYNSDGDFALNKISVKPEKEKVLNMLINSSISCNDSLIRRTGEDGNYTVIGMPTEAALLIMGAKAKIFKEDLKSTRIQEVPFSSERKIMSVMCKKGSEKIIHVKGAFEMLIDKCKFIQRKDGIFRLLEKDKKRISEINKDMTSDSFRTLVIAYKKDGIDEKEIDENGLIFLGIVGLEDPPREEVKEALKICKSAGIKVKMITGDNKLTALSIAKQIGFDSGKVLEGYEIDKLSDDELSKIVNDVVIFARVKPEHKLKIVRALKKNGEIVTMTGDGVNDAPALKEAHIGVAMGKNGTDVSRSVADLTLKDDNFATIVDAIKEGRGIFNNIRKFVTYQLSCNYAELTVLFFGVLLASFFGWPVPILLALQILFMNIVTDNLPAITLGFNNYSNDIMLEKPRKKTEILNKDLIILLIFAGSLMALFTLIAFYISFNILGESVEYSRTVALATLIGLEISGAFVFRSFRKNVLNRSPFVNMYLVYASIISIIATLIIIYTSANHVFETVPLPGRDWIIILSVGLLFIIIFDMFKRINKKKGMFNFDK